MAVTNVGVWLMLVAIIITVVCTALFIYFENRVDK